MLKFPFNKEPDSLTRRETERKRYKALLGAIIISIHLGIPAITVYNIFNLNNNQKILIQKYEEFFDSPEKYIDLKKFSPEDLALIIAELTSNNYDPVGYEPKYAQGLPVIVDNGGICRHKAFFLKDYFNIIFGDESYNLKAYFIGGEYKNNKGKHAINAIQYTINGIEYTIFIDSTIGEIGYYDPDAKVVKFDYGDFELKHNTWIVNFDVNNNATSIETDDYDFVKSLSDISISDKNFVEKNKNKCEFLKKRKEAILKKYKDWYEANVLNNNSNYNNSNYELSLLYFNFYLAALKEGDVISIETDKLKELYECYFSLRQSMMDNSYSYHYDYLPDNNNYIVYKFFDYLDKFYTIEDSNGEKIMNDEELKNGFYVQVIDDSKSSQNHNYQFKYISYKNYFKLINPPDRSDDR